MWEQFKSGKKSNEIIWCMCVLIIVMDEEANVTIHSTSGQESKDGMFLQLL